MRATEPAALLAAQTCYKGQQVHMLQLDYHLLDWQSCSACITLYRVALHACWQHFSKLASIEYASMS